MFTLRCTQKLLERLHADPRTETAASDTVLGDWYANVVRAGRTHVVLAVSERTLLPVVVAVKESRTLVQRFSEALEPLLLSIGIEPEDILAERLAMRAHAFGKTANRRVRGSLNDLAFQLEVSLRERPQLPLLGHSLWLAQTPMKLINYGAPDTATKAAFAAHHAIRKASRP